MSDPTTPVLPSLPPNLPPVNFTRLECLWLLRRIRADRDGFKENLLALEERIRGGHNGDLVNGHHAISADVAIADGIIQKLWVCSGLSGGVVPP